MYQKHLRQPVAPPVKSLQRLKKANRTTTDKSIRLNCAKTLREVTVDMAMTVLFLMGPTNYEKSNTWLQDINWPSVNHTMLLLSNASMDSVVNLHTSKDTSLSLNQ